jgi:hypothetical protein
MTTRLFSIDGGSLDFDASVPCIIATYSGFVLSEDFRRQCEEGLIQIRKKVAEHGKVAWITNLTKSEILQTKMLSGLQSIGIQMHTQAV